MGSNQPHQPNKARRSGFTSVIRLVLIGLAVVAVVKELRSPPDERTWHGTLIGFIPYELRRPTLARVKERMWDPESETVCGPRVFGVGWTVNLGRVVALVRERVSAAD